MLQFFKRLYPLVDRATRIRLLVAAGWMLVLAFLEAVALVTLVPLMQILTAPDMRSTSRTVVLAARLLGHPAPGRLAAELGVATIVVYVVKDVLAMVVLRWTTTFALRQEAEMVRRLMRLYLGAPYRRHLEANSAEFVRTLNGGVRQIFGTAFVQGLSATGDLFSIVFIGAVLFAQNPLVAGVAGVYFALVVVGYQRGLRHIIDRAARKVHRDQATDLQTVAQALGAAKEVKVRGVEEYYVGEVYRLRSGMVPAYRTFSLSNITPRYVLELAMVGATAVISAIVFSTESAVSATATVGIFLAGGFRLLAPLNKVVFGMTQAKVALPAIEQVADDLVQLHNPDAAVEAIWDPLIDLSGQQLRPRIELRDVSFSYDPGRPVLCGVSFTIEPGEAVGLVGGSGAGKSTLLDLLLGLLEAESGSVLIDGWPLGSVRREWLNMIGYVPQSIGLFDETVRANVALGVPRALVEEDQVWAALRLAQLDEVVRALPLGADTKVGEAGVRLSGGQRQRLGVARALYHRPKVLMFDEATSALDNETEFKLTEVLESLRGQMTTITIAHRLSTVRRCDRVLYLEQGRIAAMGTFSGLNETIPGFARLVELSTLHV